MLALVRLGRKSVNKGLIRVVSAARARMASGNVALKDEVEMLRRAVKEQVGAGDSCVFVLIKPRT